MFLLFSHSLGELLLQPRALSKQRLTGRSHTDWDCVIHAVKIPPFVYRISGVQLLEGYLFLISLFPSTCFLLFHPFSFFPLSLLFCSVSSVINI